MREIAKILLKLKAVTLSPEDPYTWASGIKSPIYCDNRLTLSYPEDRSTVEKGLVDLIKDQYPEVQYIMGTATAGIPHAAIIADKMGLPMGFVRSSNKDHGKQNKIEGARIEGAKVVVVEDLISTGGSSLKAVAALREAGFEVVGMVASYTYGFPVAEEAFKEAQLKLVTLTDYEHVVEKALEIGYIKQDDIALLNDWRKDPSNWKK